jgi:hypothetical protein
MRVRIVCYEDIDKWILGKFARKLHENLSLLNIESDISNEPDNCADINHHIIYYDYKNLKTKVDTLMITHIDNISKFNRLKNQLEVASMGICMSRNTMEHLSNLGIPRDKICYVNPAHDGVIKPKKIIIGITCRVQEDGRKNENYLSKLTSELDENLFSFKIMGDCWEKQVQHLRDKKFEVTYFNKFCYDQYIKLIPTFDYYLYMGEDEGQMGFIDALAAGVKTIVTAQGYHLDAVKGITHPFTGYDELRNIFKKIEREKVELMNSVATWNWLDYTKKHVEIWNYLNMNLETNDGEIFSSNYFDGLNSIGSNLDNEKKYGVLKKVKIKLGLINGLIAHNYYIYKNLFNKYSFKILIKEAAFRIFTKSKK